MRKRMTALLAAVLLTAAACDWPRDPGGTRDRVRDGVLRAGVTANPPWTVLPENGEPTGVEPDLVRRLAERLGARVEWRDGSESELMTAIKDRNLDLVVGGLDATAPWIAEASLTRPYVTTRTLIAAPPGVTVPEDLAGVRITVAEGTKEAGTLAGEDADVVTVDEVTGRENTPVVVDEWQLGPLGLAESTHELGAEDHVWALPPGENGWQVEVEGFLLDLERAEVLKLAAANAEAGR